MIINGESLKVYTRRIQKTEFDLLNSEVHKVIPIQTSRGCPHDCEFCSSSKLFGTKYRYKPIKNIIDEILALKKVYRKPYIYFADDNMTVNRRYTKNLLEEIIPLKIRLSLIKESGCTNLLFGFESLSKKNLETIELWKAQQVNKYADSIKKIQSYGIGVFGSFILGLDEDTVEAFEELRNFIIENYLFGAIITVQTPLPGTRLYDRLKKENRITSTDWSNYTLFDVVIQPKNMSREQLQEGMQWVYGEVYSSETVRKRTLHFKKVYSDMV